MKFQDRMQKAIGEFHATIGQPIGDPASPQLADYELRIKLIEEEAKETCDAIRDNDLIGAIDGVCDLVYVAIGAMVQAGIDLQPFFDEVHRTNMAKSGGPLREDGKRLKPPGWAPPDIAGILRQQVALAKP